MDYVIRIRTAGTLRASPDWLWDHPGMNNRQFVFWIITEGQGRLRAGDDDIPLGRGDCIISPMADPHHGRQEPSRLLTIPWAVFDFTIPPSSQAVIPTPLPQRHRRVEDPAFLEHLVSRAVSCFLTRPAQTRTANWWMKSALLEVAVRDAQPGYYGQERETYERIDALARKIRRVPGAPYTLESLAQSVNCSPDHLIRLFRKFKKLTPIEFLIQCRIEEAQRLLLFSSHPIGMIAEMLGYTDTAYFSRQFTRRVGASPSRYRRGG